MEKGNISIEELSNPNRTDGSVLSKNTLLKITRYTTGSENHWCPQSKTLDKFVAYINENFSRSISVYDLINDDLSGVEFTRIEKQDCLRFYEGLYYCYYNRKNQVGFQRKYGLIRIFKTDTNQYSCEAIFGISSEKFFKLPNPITISKNQNLRCFHDNKENPFEFFYRGSFFLAPESVVAHLIPDHSTFMKILIFKRQEAGLSHFDGFVGDIIGMLTTTHSINHPTVYQPLAISKERLANNVDIDAFLTLNNCDNKLVKNNEQLSDGWIDTILEQRNFHK